MSNIIFYIKLPFRAIWGLIKLIFTGKNSGWND